MKRHSLFSAAVAAATLAWVTVGAGPAPASAAPTPARIPSRPGVVDTGIWHLRTSLSAGPDTLQFAYGRRGDDRAVMGDWNGDGTATVGVVRRARDGIHLEWLLRNSNTAGTAQIAFIYGLAGNPNTPAYYDYPVVGDWDGNGTDTPGVVRITPHGMTFLLRNSVTSGPAQIAFSYGRTGFPVVGDWDGNGTDTAGVVRDDNLDPGHHLWFLRNQNTAGPADITFIYGLGEDFPISGDRSGSGKDTPGVVRFVPAGLRAEWLLRDSTTSGPAQRNFFYGRGDRPVVVW